MYCRNCGKEIADNAAVCIHCGVSTRDGKKFCPNCGAATADNAVVCVSCGVSLSNAGGKGSSASGNTKSKVLIGLLAVIPFVTNFGIHWYMLGEMKKFTVNIIVFIISSILLLFAGIGFIGYIALWIYNLITGVKILTGSITQDANGIPIV
ncbi:MAG: zinc-ribbon domain-containing protein [Acutalibacteraceae bacterium]